MVLHMVLKVHRILSALVKFVEADSGEAGLLSQSTCDNNY